MAKHIDISNTLSYFELKEHYSYDYQMHNQRTKEGKKYTKIKQNRPITLQNGHNRSQRHRLTDAI